MKVKLVDVDNKYREPMRRGKRFPNLALMKLSAYHKARGDLVGFDIEDPDITHISCVFTRNAQHAIEEAARVTKGISYGGSGIAPTYTLPPNIEMLKPDYDLYFFCEYSLGFTSRGCPNHCEWCIVPEKEGKFRRAQHIKEFHDFRFKSCKLLDNNILADREWFFENTNWAIENNVRLNITQGMDIRLLTDEIAEQLHRIKFVDQQMCFAWDRIELEPVVKSGIEMLRDHGINVKRNVSFFVLTGYHRPGEKPAPFCKDAYRCNRLREMGVMAYAMPYNEETTPLIKALARWTSRRTAYRASPFWRYERMPKPEAIA
jgi:hypothetical protein